MDQEPNSGPESIPPVPPSGTPPEPSTPPRPSPAPEVPPPPQPSISGGESVPPESAPPPVLGESGNVPSQDERFWAVLIHLGGAAGLIVATWGIPGNLLLPLIFWLLERDAGRFVDDQGKEAINFQITITIAGAICVFLIVTLVFACVGIPLMIALGVYTMVVAIIAAVKANEGIRYRYPLTIRFIK